MKEMIAKAIEHISSSLGVKFPDSAYKSLTLFSEKKAKFVIDAIQNLPLYYSDCPWCLNQGHSDDIVDDEDYDEDLEPLKCDGCAFMEDDKRCDKDGSKYKKMEEAKQAFIDSIRDMYTNVPTTLSTKGGRVLEVAVNVRHEDDRCVYDLQVVKQTHIGFEFAPDGAGTDPRVFTASNGEELRSVDYPGFGGFGDGCFFVRGKDVGCNEDVKITSSGEDVANILSAVSEYNAYYS